MSVTEREAVTALMGMMETIKRTAGPALGLVKKHWPQAEGVRGLLRTIYEEAAWVQDQVRRL